MPRRIARAALGAVSIGLLAFAWRADIEWFDRHIFLPQQFFIVANHAIVPAARAGAVLLALGFLLLAWFPPRRMKLDELLPILLLQVGLVLAVSRLVGQVFARLHQPQVVGEMAAGIMLGPSLFGWVAKSVHAAGWITRVSGTFSSWWDKWVIDGIGVNGPAILARMLSYPARLLEWGLVQWYALVMTAGLVGFVFYYVYH